MKLLEIIFYQRGHVDNANKSAAERRPASSFLQFTKLAGAESSKRCPKR